MPTCGEVTHTGDACQRPTDGRPCFLHDESGPPSTHGAPLGNDNAVGNSGGGAPRLNSNAEIHGGFGEWRKVYDRLDGKTKEHTNLLIADLREIAREHAPDIDPERREELIQEYATLSIMHEKASCDAFAFDTDGARGFVIEEERESGGETYTSYKANPALRASRSHTARQRELSEELCLYPAYWDN